MSKLRIVITLKRATKFRTASSIFVVMGRTNLSSTNQTHLVESLVSEIIVHPDWNYTADNFDADVAILKLEKPIRFNPNVKAIKLQSTCQEFYHIGYSVSFSV